MRIGNMKGMGALTLVDTREVSLHSLVSWPMMSRMLVLQWPGILAIVLAVSLVARAQPHGRRDGHVFVREYRAVTLSGAAGRQRS